MVGRSALCDIYIDRATISHRHALLRIGPPLSLEDLGSTNGTRLRGAAMPPGEPQPLAPGDVIDLGSLSAMVELRAAAPRGRRLLSHHHFQTLVEAECGKDGGKGSLAVLRIHCVAQPDARKALPALVSDLVETADVAGFCAPGEYEALFAGTPHEEVRRKVRRLVDAHAIQVGAAFFPGDGTDAPSLIAAAAAQIRSTLPLMPAHPMPVAGPAGSPSAVELLRAAVRDEQRQRIVDALARCSGNQTMTAKLLGISRRRLLFLLDRHDLPRPRKRMID